MGKNTEILVCAIGCWAAAAMSVIRAFRDQYNLTNNLVSPKLDCNLALCQNLKGLLGWKWKNSSTAGGGCWHTQETWKASMGAKSILLEKLQLESIFVEDKWKLKSPVDRMGTWDQDVTRNFTLERTKDGIRESPHGTRTPHLPAGSRVPPWLASSRHHLPSLPGDAQLMESRSQNL